MVSQFDESFIISNFKEFPHSALLVEAGTGLELVQFHNIYEGVQLLMEFGLNFGLDEVHRVTLGLEEGIASDGTLIAFFDILEEVALLECVALTGDLRFPHQGL